MTRPGEPRDDSASTHDHPTSVADTVSFGSGTGPEQPVPMPDVDEPARRPGEVDAWYSEPDPEAEKEQRPTWWASRWQGWQTLDRDRRVVIVLVVVAVLALLVALVGMVSRDDNAAIELPAVESHGLNPDEAACFAFGLIENRFDVRLGPEGFDTPDPTILSGPINQEILAIDDLPANHPEADYQLITAFAAVADAATVLSDAEGFADFRSAIADRADAVASAEDACNEVAGFDVTVLEPN